jgi:hypothetical protein
MSIAKTLLPPEAEDDRRPDEQPTRGLSLEDAIHEFVRIQNRYIELGEEKKRCLEVLIPAAEEAKTEKSKTSRIANHDNTVVLKAEFKSNIDCDVDTLNEVKEMLGDDVFETLFKTEYSPRQRALQPFLATKSTDERIETAKGKIALALTFNPAPARITVEKGQYATPMPWEKS